MSKQLLEACKFALEACKSCNDLDHAAIVLENAMREFTAMSKVVSFNDLVRACEMTGVESVSIHMVRKVVADAIMAEREACAALADKMMDCYNHHRDDCRCNGVAAFPSQIATSIRERSAP